MSYIPETVATTYSLLKTQKDYSEIQSFKFPKDKRKISNLTLDEKMIWYAAQDPHELITISADNMKDHLPFANFWFRNYILPLRLKRFIFWFKFW